MSRIAWLERKIAEASEMLVADEARVQSEPGNLGLSLGLASMRAHINDLRHQLHLERAARAKEVVGLRLTGERLKFGSIPLPLLARIADTLSGAWAALAWRAQHGDDPKRLPDDFVAGLNLCLAGLTSGSTQLAITGNTLPDLLGDSPVEAGLRATFSLLQAEPEQIAQRAAEAGTRATRRIAQLLRTFERERCGAEIARKSSQLSALQVKPPQTMDQDCEVELLAKTGRVGLRSLDTGEKISAHYPRDLYSAVQELHLGHRARFRLQLSRVFNENTQQEVKSYTLLGLAESAPA